MRKWHQVKKNSITKARENENTKKTEGKSAGFAGEPIRELVR